MKTILQKVIIRTTTQGAEALAPVLEGIGVTAYCIEDPADLKYITDSATGAVWDYIEPSLEANNDEDVILSFYLPENDTESVKKAKLTIEEIQEDVNKGVYGDSVDFGTMVLETTLICDDWEERSKAFFHTFSPAEGVIIRPPWEECFGDDNETVIVINPGMAFGTGSHETTSMCLSALSNVLVEDSRKKVLDVGTGSGILAIFAALRGAANVVAVEIDSDAAASAAENISNNGVKDRIDLVIGDCCRNGVLPDDDTYDVILANLTIKLLESLLLSLKKRLAPGGVFILSGLLDVQESSMCEYLDATGLEIIEIIRQSEWIAVVAGMRS